MAEEYTISFSYNDRVLSVLPVHSQYEFVSATVSGHLLDDKEVSSLLSRVQESYNDENGDSMTTPKKLFQDTDNHSSPSSVAAASENQKVLYDEDFIGRLRHELFSVDLTPAASTQVVEEHIPILLSIEGNIGAGKSEY